jgi:hypothetical protein
MGKDYYSTLGVTRNATEAEIKNAYVKRGGRGGGEKEGKGKTTTAL